MSATVWKPAEGTTVQTDPYTSQLFTTTTEQEHFFYADRANFGILDDDNWPLGPADSGYPNSQAPIFAMTQGNIVIPPGETTYGWKALFRGEVKTKKLLKGYPICTFQWVLPAQSSIPAGGYILFGIEQANTGTYPAAFFAFQLTPAALNAIYNTATAQTTVDITGSLPSNYTTTFSTYKIVVTPKSVIFLINNVVITTIALSTLQAGTPRFSLKDGHMAFISTDYYPSSAPPYLRYIDLFGREFPEVYLPYPQGSKLNVQVTANTDIFATALSPLDTPTTFRVYAVFNLAGVLSVRRKSGATTVSEQMNQGGTLSPNAGYTFDVPVDSGETINLQYGIGATALKVGVYELQAVQA